MKRLGLITIFNLLCIVGFGQEFLWVDGVGSTGSDAAFSVTTDAAGNVYTTGSFSGTIDIDPGLGVTNLVSVGGLDAFVAKFNSAGSLIWAKSFGGSSLEQGNAIKLNAAGDVFIGGTFGTTVDFDPGAGVVTKTVAAVSDAFILKLNSLGEFVWVSVFAGTGNEQVKAIDIDASGNVLSTGFWYMTCDFDPGAGVYNILASVTNSQNSAFVSKLDQNGNFVWAGEIGGGQFHEGYTIETDASENVYIGGYALGGTDYNPGAGSFTIAGGGGQEAFIVKLNSAGAFITAVKLNGAGHDMLNGLSLDATGNVIATGFYNGTTDFDPGAGTSNITSLGIKDVFVVKLNASLGFVWAKSFGSTADDTGYSVSCDNSDNVYVTGIFQGTVDFDPGAGTLNRTSAGGNDVFIVKLNSTGDLTFAKKCGGSSSDLGLSINVTGSGNSIYTVGAYTGICNFNSDGGAYYEESNTNSQDIYIHKIGTCFQPANQTLAATPSAICAGSSATINLGSSEVGSFYYLRNNSDNSVVQGPIAGNGGPISFNTGTLNATTTYNVYSSSILLPTNYALDLDGVNDYISLGTGNRGITNAVTVSSYVRSTVNGTTQYIADKYLSAGIGYYLIIDANGYASFQGRDVAGGIKTSGLSTTMVADNQWHDITGVVRSTGWEIWVDGVLENSGAYTLGGTGLGTGADLLVGQFNSVYSPLDIDRLAIWNTALSPALILSNASSCLVGNEANLVAYFPFSEGNGTATTDFSTTGVNGTLTNMTVPADWISQPLMSCSSSCEVEMGNLATVTVNANPTQPTITSSGANAICAGSSLTLTASAGTTYLWSTGATTPSISTSTAGAYTVQVTNAAGCQSVASVATNVLVNTLPLNQTVTPASVNICSGGSATINVASTEAGVNYTLVNDATNAVAMGPVQGTGSPINFNLTGITSSTTYHVNAQRGNGILDLDGTNDYVTCGTDNRGITSTITVTAKVKTTITGTSQFIVSKYISAGIGYYLVITSGGQASFQGRDISGGIKTSGNSTTMVADNQWHEITGVLRGALWEIWVDGVLQNSNTYTPGITVETTAPLLIGQFNSTYCPADIDEVAIWKSALSPATILYNYSNCLVGNETNLVALLKFNEISGTVATDSSPLAMNGTLTNMTAPACWVAGPASACLGTCEFELSQLSTINVVSAPSQPTISASGSTMLCSGGSVTLTASTGTSYLWSNGATTPSIVVSTAGTYTVQVTNAAGCQSVASAGTTVIVGTLPAQPIVTAGGATTFCAGGSVTLTSSAGTSYLWSNGATTAAISPTTSGTYTVQVTNASGCQSVASAGTAVTVNALPSQPTINAGGSTTFCAGGSVTLTSSAGTSYLWSNGATTASISPTTAGTFTVQVTNAAGCQSVASAGTAVTVNALPSQPTISAGGATTFCVGGSVTLTSSAGTSYLWSNGATTAAISPTTAGNYSVQVTNAAGCQSVASAGTAVTVNTLPAQPTISAGGSTTFCAGGSVTLTSSAGTSYLWSNGATTASISPTTAGTFTVQVTNAAGCQSAASTGTTVTVNALPSQPTITAGGATTFCTGGSVTLTSSAGSSYLWSDGSMSASINPSSSGTYTVQVTNAAGCQSVASASTVVTVNSLPSQPTISASGATTFCAGGSVTLTSAAGSGYLWSNGATTASISTTTAGTFTVQVTNAAGCQSVPSAATTVTVNALPVIAQGTLTNPTSCTIDNGSIEITGTGNGDISWTGTSNGSLTGITLPATISGLSDGSFNVTFTNASGCASNTISSSLTAPSAPAAPTITASGATTFCAGGSVTLTSSNGTAYLWSNGETTASIQVSDAGSYTVSITDASGCSSAASNGTSVTLNALPVIATGTITNPSSCTVDNGSIEVTGVGTGDLFWTGTASGSSTAITLPSTINGLGDGSYDITFTDALGCTSLPVTSSLSLPGTPSAPIISASGATTFCEGGSVTLTSSTGTTYLWSNGATTASIDVVADGTYTVIITNADGCTSPASATTTVAVDQLPDVTVTEVNNTITATQSGAGYQWIDCGNGNQPIAGATGISFSPTVNGSYAVIIASGTCSDTSACTVISTIGISEHESVYIGLHPNPGTDIVQVTASGEIQEIELFSAAGELIRIEKIAHFDIRDLARGVYIIKVTTNQGTGMVRLVKE